MPPVAVDRARTDAADAPRKAATRSEHVRELLEEGIATGTFPPGMRLDEVELAQRFDVSRTPLREALFQLASAGITGVRFLALDVLDPTRYPTPELPFPVPWNYVPAAPSSLASMN